MQRVAAGLVVAVAALGAVLLYGARGARPPRPRVPPRASARAVRVRRAVARRARPPQFVVVSFDGSGGAPLWSYWRSVAKRVHAHFTFFVSGVYLVDWAHHDEYAPPRGPRGESAIGFAPDEAWIRAMRRQMALGYLDGDEIGTHFNGHFCGPGGVDTWNAADWTSELAQYDAFLFSPRTHLPFGRSEIVGGRTPCLEGKLSVVDPVLAAHGFRYDASRQALLGTWPTRVHGLWSFPLLEVPFIGHTFRVTSMDYNFMANQIDESPARIENETERTLLNAFRAEYLGRRAPLSFGWHFETWESRAYVRALTRVLGRVCRLPEVRCVSYRELADWLDATPRRVLARYRTGRFPRMNRA
jgi:hypothetical protein